MTPEQIERVFGRGRLKMVTGEHVEVFREAVAPGERRRYTKRFLNTREGDFGQWTEREWRILARLIGHGIACVPDVVQYDRGRVGGEQLVQTYDAGVTVDQWATLLPVARDGCCYRHVFEDCAHWWAFAHHCLRALHEIHPLELVHLDIKGDNVCIPYAPPGFDPHSTGERLRPAFGQLALIDFAFALVSRESLTTPLPIGWQKDYDYQSPRMLAALDAGRNGEMRPTRELDWRCDMYSLAAMLKRYLPEWTGVCAAGWTGERYAAAKALILRIRDTHDAELSAVRPHAALIEETGARIADPELHESLERGWTLAHDAGASPQASAPLTPVTLLTPVTKLAAPVVARSGRTAVVKPLTAVTVIARTKDAAAPAPTEGKTGFIAAASPGRRPRRHIAVAVLVALAAFGAVAWQLADRAGVVDLAQRWAQREGAAPAPHEPPVADRERAPDSSAAPAEEPSLPNSEIAAARAPSLAAAPAPPMAAAPVASPPSMSAVEPSWSQPMPAVPRSRVQRSRAGAPVTPSSSTDVAQTTAPLAADSAASIVPAPKAAGTPARGLSKPSRASAAAPVPPARTIATRPSSPPRRALPAWVSLEPPGWLRTGKPPNPPGMMVAEARAPTVTSATETSRETAAPASTSSGRTDRASASGTHPSPAIAVAPPSPPAGGASVAAGGADSNSAPAARSRGSSFGAAQAAPIEERKDAFAKPPPYLPAVREVEPKPPVPEDYAGQARRMLVEAVPRHAMRAEPEVARILWLASADDPMQDRFIADAARAVRIPNDGSLGVCPGPVVDVRRLSDEARAAAGSRRNVSEMLDRHLQAFGANPRDPEVAGNLALLHLKLMPPQPDRARQLALFALTARCPEHASARIEDWNTFAVASALSGREADATRALFVTLALAGNGEARCVAALDALSSYGERMRGPVEAMFYRMRSQGRGNYSPACAWPATFTARRLP